MTRVTGFIKILLQFAINAANIMTEATTRLGQLNASVALLEDKETVSSGMVDSINTQIIILSL